MSADRQLTSIEAALTPTELVLRWLAEAHAYDSFDAYARAVLETDPDNLPMDRLAREAEDCARARSRGKPREEVQTAVRKAVVGTLFRAQVVLQINVRTHEFLDREVLIHAAFSAYVAMAVNPPRRRPKSGPVVGPTELRNACIARVTELHAFEEARAQVERTHLAGATALFPAAVREWDEQRTRTDTLGVMAIRMTELDGVDDLPPDDEAAFDARVAQIIADHVEPARSKAYHEIGDGRRAMDLAVRWLRSKQASAP